MALLRKDFVALKNFPLGNENFRNTCFIAVVANVRHVLQPVMQAVQNKKWNDYVNLVRSTWDGQYSYAPEHDGQHDAAELLGAILHEHASRFGLEVCVCVTKTVFCEFNHYTQRLEHVAMIVLVLPNDKNRFTLCEF